MAFAITLLPAGKEMSATGKDLLFAKPERKGSVGGNKIASGKPWEKQPPKGRVPNLYRPEFGLLRFKDGTWTDVLSDFPQDRKTTNVGGRSSVG